MYMDCTGGLVPGPLLRVDFVGKLHRGWPVFREPGSGFPALVQGSNRGDVACQQVQTENSGPEISMSARPDFGRSIRP